MQGAARVPFRPFPTADGRCRTGCCTPPHWFFAVSVFVSTGAATAPRWETIHGKLKNDRGSNRPVPDRACGRINLGSMSALVEAVSHDPALVLVSGVLAFVAGLAVVRVHNHRAADWAVLVTIFGWLLLIGGLVRMLFPIWLAGMAATFSPSTGLIVGEAVVFLVIGAFLSYKAYISS